MATAQELEQELRDDVRDRDAEIARLRAEVAAWRARYDRSAVRDMAYTNSADEVAPLYTALDTGARVDAAVPRAFP